jgi:membrane-associated phospholipid phosphatase
MRRRTTALVTLAVAAAAAAAIAVPALAMTGSAAPPAALAETAGSGQSVIDWNRQLVSILGAPGTQPATVHPTRSFAMLQAAEYNAVVSITRAAPPYRSAVPAPAGARPDAAADQAAHDVLVALYPSKQADLDAQLRTELAAIPDSQPKRDGIGVGAAAARQLVDLRSADGSAAAGAPFVAGDRPGDYRPTPPKFPAPMYPNWGRVTPFVLDNAQQFRPAAPAPVSSAEYASALDEVRNLGRDTSTTRTPDQTVAGKFWSGTPIWVTWNQVAQQLTADRHASLAQATAVFSSLDLSLADTTIALYDAKYADHIWRPVTAIQLSAATDNPAIVADPTWNPLTPTAADPSYPGAHSALSAAAATVLSSFYGPQQAVTISSPADPGVTRSFATLAGAADEAGLSRIWSGQHTRLDHQAGQQLGRQVAELVLRDLPMPNAG